MEFVLTSPTTVVLTFISVFSVFYGIYFLVNPQHHPKEPPVVTSSIPLVGHIIGLIWHGTRYYQKISEKYGLPIFTLNVLNGKIYVITSPSLINAVNRNSKVLAFNPFIAALGMRITGHDEATSRIVQHNLNGEDGTGYVIDLHDNMVAALAPKCEDLANMTGGMLDEASLYIDAVQGQTVDLFAWIRKMVTMASTSAVYGPHNPFKTNPELMTRRFWEFDSDLNRLIMNIAPRFTAPIGNRGRAEVALQFKHYYEKLASEDFPSSAYARVRYETATRYNITAENQGRLEVGSLIGVLANTIPSFFYTLVHTYADPDLLRDVRRELETIAVVNKVSGSRRLRIMTVRDGCPLLNGVFSEMLRIHALGAGSRFVREDILLDNQFLLKKGMVVQIPAAVLHSDAAYWGPDVETFNPRRFMNKYNVSAYRPFGGGASLCPGRHFVRLETVALAAIMVLKYDIRLADGSQWHIPSQKQENLATNVFPPEKDIRVEIRAREGFEDVSWEFEMT